MRIFALCFAFLLLPILALSGPGTRAGLPLELIYPLVESFQDESADLKRLLGSIFADRSREISEQIDEVRLGRSPLVPYGITRFCSSLGCSSDSHFARYIFAHYENWVLRYQCLQTRSQEQLMYVLSASVSYGKAVCIGPRAFIIKLIKCKPETIDSLVERRLLDVDDWYSKLKANPDVHWNELKTLFDDVASLVSRASDSSSSSAIGLVSHGVSSSSSLTPAVPARSATNPASNAGLEEARNATGDAKKQTRTRSRSPKSGSGLASDADSGMQSLPSEVRFSTRCHLPMLVSARYELYKSGPLSVGVAIGGGAALWTASCSQPIAFESNFSFAPAFVGGVDFGFELNQSIRLSVSLSGSFIGHPKLKLSSCDLKPDDLYGIAGAFGVSFEF